jgi:two-component system, sensor histidine kinase and response regulator
MYSKTKKVSLLAQVDRWYEIISKIAGPVAIATGGIVLVGWVAGIRNLTSIVPGYSTMKPNTAVCFILCGVSLLLIRASEKKVSTGHSIPIRLAKACALAVTVLGLLILSEHIFQVDLGIDQIILRDTLSNSPSGHPGQASVATAFGLFVLGGSLFFLGSKSILSASLSQILALIALVDATIGGGAYVYGVENLYAVTLFTTMAAPTAVLLMFLSIGALFARPKRGPISVITSPHSGGQMARLILPWAVTIPFFIGWVRLQGEQAGLYGAEFGVAVFATSNVIMFAILVWGSAKSLNTRSLESIQSENRYRFLADAMPEIVWTTKADGNVDYFNQRWFDYTGLTIEQTKDWGWTPVVHPEDLDHCVEVWTKSIKTGCAYEVEYRFKRSDGIFRWHLGRAFALRNDKGEIVQWVGSCTDIDDQKRARTVLEQRVEERTKELQEQALILDLANDTVFIRDKENRIIYWNQGAERLYGWSKAEALGKVTHTLFQTEFPDSLDNIEAKIAAHGHWEGELRHTRRDGSIVTVASSWTLQRDAHGQPASIIELNYDITPRKQAEEELRKSRERLDAILIGSLDGVIVYEAVRDEAGIVSDLRFAMLNPAAERLMRLKASELIGNTILEKFPSVAKDGLFTKFTKIIEENVTLDFEHKSERTEPPRWYRLAGVKLGDGLAISYTEITARKLFEKELHEAKERAESADKAKSEFLAIMSHEIRTPMNGVIGMTSILGDTELNEMQRDCLNTIQTSGESLLAVINDILDYSKIEAGKLELESSPFNLRKCIEGALDLFAAQIRIKRLEAAYLIAPGVPHNVTGDSTRLRQILINLVGNAIKFTTKGEIVINVECTKTDEAGSHLLFSVSDTGIGIAKESLQKLFQSFQQVDTSTTRRFGGTGLGLVISKRLAEFMHGKMWVESEPGKGSTFFFSAFFKQSREVLIEDELPDAASLQARSALIVDDNEVNRRIMAAQLTIWGMNAIASASGPEALKILSEQTFDVALIDFQMPEMDGVTLAREINRKTKLPLILLSSSGERIKGAEAVLFQFQIPKPIKHSILFNALLKVIGVEIQRSTAIPIRHFDKDMAAKHPLSILLAEDNPTNQKVGLLMLSRLGYVADLARDGQKAVDAVQLSKYDLILMDIQMPDMNGIEATRLIRERLGKECPTIVALTAEALEGDEKRFLGRGFDGYLSKPLQANKLQEVLGSVKQIKARTDDRPIAFPAPSSSAED